MTRTAKAGGDLDFVPNIRQWPEQVQYRTDLPGGAVFFTADRFVYSYYSLEDLERIHELAEKKENVRNATVRGHAYQVIFAGCNEQAAATGSHMRSHYHNYFLGKDSSKWSAHVPVYEGIRYDKLYPGIDLSVYSNGASMKYDFIVGAGADPSLIRLQFKGAIPKLTRDGAVEIRTSVNTVIEQAPYVYQLIDGQKKEVKCRYMLNDRGEIGFAFPEGYDRRKVLIIDPTLVFATWSGTATSAFGESAAYDQTGNTYGTAQTFAVGWPVTTGAFQTTFGGSTEVAVNKYTSNGTALIYSTHLGGGNTEFVNQAVAGNAGELIVFGTTDSPDFPVTAGCYDNTYNGNYDYFVTHFNAAGSAVLGSTLIGGVGDEYRSYMDGDVIVEPSGNIVCAGTTFSPDFPVTAGTYQSASGGELDVCVFKLDAGCSSLLASTYLGGHEDEIACAVKLAGNGNIIVCGSTASGSFPATPGTVNPTFSGGGSDGFVSILNPGCTALLYSTFLGTTEQDRAYKLQVDDSNKIYVAGETAGNYPVTPGLYTNANGGVFVHVLSPALTDIMSTRLGSPATSMGPGPIAFLVDGCRSVYYAIFTSSIGLPLTPNAFQNAGGIYIAQITSGITSLSYATYLNGGHNHGQAVFDPLGNLYTSLCGPVFPTTPGAWRPNSLIGALDALTFKFQVDPVNMNAAFDIDGDDTGCAPFTVTFTNTSTGSLTYYWDFGDGTTSTLAAPTHTYLLPGTYQVMLAVENTGSCTQHDTAYGTVVVITNNAEPHGSVVDDTGCAPFLVQTVNNSVGSITYEWDFGDGTPLVPGATPTHLYPSPGRYRVVLHAYDSSLCRPSNTDTFYVRVLAQGPVAGIDLQVNDSGCVPYLAALGNVSTGASTYLWDFGDGTTSGAQFPGSHLYSNPGTYEVVLYAHNYDSLVCKPADTDRVMVHVFPRVEAEMTVSDTSVCEGEALAFTAQVNYEDADITWDFGDGTRIGRHAAPSHAYDTSGLFNVTLTVRHPICPDTLLEAAITVVPTPSTVLGPDTSICLYGEPVVLMNAAYNPANRHLWNTNDTTESILARHHGVFWVRTTNAEGCTSADSIEVFKSCYIDIPNAFTPNGDGNNDYFFPRQLLSKQLTGFKMQVFNRWGQIVFETTKPDGRGWDGRFNNKDQPQGVYIYLIDAALDGERMEKYRGNVTLLR